MRSPAAAALVLVALACAACLGGGSQKTASGATIIVTGRPSPSPSFGGSRSVYVLTPVGLNLRSAPGLDAPRVATIRQSVQLDVGEAQKLGTDTWLHVKTHDAAELEGWVLDSPDLVIHLAVSQHIDSAAGWSMLFPSTWTLKSGNPTTFTSPPSDPEGGTLLVQTGTDVNQLAATPTSTGTEVRQESPIEVYGKTTFLTVYRSSTGGYEFAVRLQFADHKAFLFDYKQSARPEADSMLFKQLLASVIVSG